MKTSGAHVYIFICLTLSVISWTALGRSRAAPGLLLSGSWAVPGLPWAAPGLLLGRSWAAPGLLLDCSWAALGRSWATPGPLLGCSRAVPGPLLGRSWAAPGLLLSCCWAAPGLLLGRPGLLLGCCCCHNNKNINLDRRLDRPWAGPQTSEQTHHITSHQWHITSHHITYITSLLGSDMAHHLILELPPMRYRCSCHR